MTKQDTKESKYKVIDYKKERDRALEAMYYYQKMGNEDAAQACLTLAAHIQAIRTKIDPATVPKDNIII